MRSGDASVRDAIDPAFGGLRELPKLPRAAQLWRLLNELEADDVAADTLARRHAGALRAASQAPDPALIVPEHLRAASARV